VGQHTSGALTRLAESIPCVLKQYRGHSGIGVWRAEVCGSSAEGPLLKVRHAQRGSEEESIDMPGLVQRMAPYFEPAQGGHMIDQDWQPRLADGMVRAYLVEDRVTGFGHQAVNALFPALPGQSAPQPGTRLYYGPDLPEFQPLRHVLESSWIQLLCERIGVTRGQLPLLCDCDFILGEPAPDGGPRFVLCEVNVSSASPFPPSSIAPLVDAMKRLLATAGR
jgi:hypothetical protein